MSEDPYVYADSQILINKLDIRDAELLNRTERRLVVQRMRSGIPQGDFDLRHLQAIHHHLFQDIYDWAGQVRTVHLAKNSSRFMSFSRIATGMAFVHRQVIEANYLAGLEAEAFAAKAAEIVGQVNYLHPFREGNGRTQLQYLKQLADRAGHIFDLRKIPADPWIEASIRTDKLDYGLMSECILGALMPPKGS